MGITQGEVTHPEVHNGRGIPTQRYTTGEEYPPEEHGRRGYPPEDHGRRGYPPEEVNQEGYTHPRR